MNITLEPGATQTKPTRNGHVERSTAAELADDSLFEIIDGKRVEKVMSLYANLMAGILFYHLQRFADDTRVGRPVIETMFALPNVGRERRPDVAFVLFETWPEDRPIPIGDSWAIAPDLAVEVISPTNQWEAVLGKVREFFHAGVKLVWVVSPRERQIYVYVSPTDVSVLPESGVLKGGDVLPGFQVSIAELFRKAGREESAS